jgi:hypothetical protein
VVWHVPGDNPVSGAYRGPVEYFETMPARMGPLDRWSIAVTDVLTNQKDDAALVAFHLEGSRRERTVDMDGLHMIRLDEAGRIVEGWASPWTRTPWTTSSRPNAWIHTVGWWVGARSGVRAGRLAGGRPVKAGLVRGCRLVLHNFSWAWVALARVG